ncbi:arsenate reductase/protein-tyrosine-phosphatase family protein [Luethyella okanaganae]|uniref:Low molecular weight phosphatase family protein n=1 Tax=Luethyella okanaganae TaxID=69372 RepID=A0ABW1V9M2_9MICO
MDTFSILTVCSGNICRSPLAEQLLRTGLSTFAGVEVTSAGTMALVGQGMTQQAQALSLRFGGVEPQRHAARELTIALIRDADLVFAMSREHRRAVVELLPRASRTTFMIREFARLVVNVPEPEFAEIAQLPRGDLSARFTAAVELAASRRGIVQHPDAPDDDNVVDPYGQSDAVYQRSAEQIVPAVRAVLTFFDRAASVALR